MFVAELELFMRLIAASMLIVFPTSAFTQRARKSPPKIEVVIERGLAFLAATPRMEEKHNCVSCHHAGLVIWATHEARGVDTPWTRPCWRS